MNLHLHAFSKEARALIRRAEAAGIEVRQQSNHNVHLTIAGRRFQVRTGAVKQAGPIAFLERLVGREEQRQCASTPSQVRDASTAVASAESRQKSPGAAAGDAADQAAPSAPASASSKSGSQPSVKVTSMIPGIPGHDVIPDGWKRAEPGHYVRDEVKHTKIRKGRNGPRSQVRNRQLSAWKEAMQAVSVLCQAGFSFDEAVTYLVSELGSNVHHVRAVLRADDNVSAERLTQLKAFTAQLTRELRLPPEQRKALNVKTVIVRRVQPIHVKDWMLAALAALLGGIGGALLGHLF